MNRFVLFLLVMLFSCPVSLHAQISITGLADFELRMAGDDSSPYVNQTPGPDLSLYTPNLRLFLSSNISEQWFVNAVLQADHYTGKKLSDPFFSLFNVNWTPGTDSDFILTAGRFVTPFGSYSRRFLSFDNPFVHLPLSHASGLPVSKKLGFLGNARQDPAAFRDLYGPDEFGMTMVYQRMYAQGLQFTYAAGDSDWLRVQLAATTAPASSFSDFGIHDTPSVIGRAEVTPVIWATLGLSYSKGAFLQTDTTGDSLLIYDASSYSNDLLGADLTLSYQYYSLVLEWNQSSWKAPYYNHATSNATSPVTGQATITHVSGEFMYDLPFVAGSYVAARFEYMSEGEIERYQRNTNGVKTGQSFTDWTYSRSRLEFAAGYRLHRNVLLKASYLYSDDNGPELDDNVFSIQLSVLF